MGLAYIIKASAELLTVHLFLKTAFQAAPYAKRMQVLLATLFFVFMVGESMYAEPMERDHLVHLIAMMLVTFSYQTEMVNRVLAAAFTFCCSICGQGIVFLVVREAEYPMVPFQMFDPRTYPWMVFGASMIQLIVAVMVCRGIEVYRAHPHSIYTSIFLIAFCLSILALEMFVTLMDNFYRPSTILTLFLVLFCIGLCIGLVREQIRVQEERPRLEFLEKHNADQLAHYTAFYKYDRDVHKMRHDLKNFVIGAQYYLKHQQYDKLEVYLDSFLGRLKPADFIDTGNPLLDAVITAKRADAPEIPFRVNIPRLTLTGIDPMDAAMLLATALDNAIEGCAGHPEPYIAIQASEQGRMLSLRVQNPTIRPVVQKKGQLITQKPDAKFHGYGIPEMQRITAKYHGHLIWNLADGIFYLQALLQAEPDTPSEQPQERVL